MNGFEMSAESCRVAIEKYNLTGKAREGMERKIKVYDFLATTNEAERMEIFNSGCFNDVLKAYCKKAMYECDIDDRKAEEVIEQIGRLLDTQTAEQITQ